MGDGIGHVALTGVALGLLTGRAPVLTAIIVAILGAVAIELVRQRGKASADVALAMLFYGGIAGGVLITGLAGSSAATLNTYLFGSITTVSTSDLWVVAGLAVVVLVIVLGLRRQFFALSQDEEYARVAGLPVRAYGILLAVLAAVTVTVSMRTVGLLLVSALMVVPVATSQQLARSFRVDDAPVDGARRCRCCARRRVLLLRRRPVRSEHRRPVVGRVRGGVAGRRGAAATPCGRGPGAAERGRRARGVAPRECRATCA